MNPTVASLLEAKVALDALISNEEQISNINQVAAKIIASFENGGRIFSCGNGGSMCDAMHFAEEMTGRYRKNRKGLPAIAIADAGHITCVSNDFGYQHIYSRYLETHGRKGDCLLAISTSGSSENIINAAKVAQANGIVVIGLTGRKDSVLSQHADITICTQAGAYADRVQELHIKVIHILIELVERHFFPELY